MLKSLAAVAVASVLSTASFALNGGRTEWIMLKALYRIFGDIAMSSGGFMASGISLYLAFWVYVSVSVYVFLKLFGEDVNVTTVFDVTALSFILPHALIFPFGLFGNYFLHISALVVFGLLVPLTLTPHSLRRASGADFYRRSLALYASLFVLFTAWTLAVEPLGVI